MNEMNDELLQRLDAIERRLTIIESLLRPRDHGRNAFEWPHGTSKPILFPDGTIIKEQTLDVPIEDLHDFKDADYDDI